MIHDTGSMHGTFLNGNRVEPTKPQVLKNHDTLTFGVTVDRAESSFPPYSLRFIAVFGTERYVHFNGHVPSRTLQTDSTKSRQNLKPVVYRVPDESDLEDVDGDDPQLKNALQILDEPSGPTESVDLTLPTTTPIISKSTFIDLTTIGPEAHKNQEPSTQSSAEDMEDVFSSPAGSDLGEEPTGFSDVEDSENESEAMSFGGNHTDSTDSDEDPGNEQEEFEYQYDDEMEHDDFEREPSDLQSDIDDWNPNAPAEGAILEDIPEESAEYTEDVDGEAFDAELLALAETTSQLPPLVTPTVHQGGISLPSISALTSPFPSSSDTLERLITSTGKPEFFYAREENRTMAGALPAQFVAAPFIPATFVPIPAPSTNLATTSVEAKETSCEDKATSTDTQGSVLESTPTRGSTIALPTSSLAPTGQAELNKKLSPYSSTPVPARSSRKRKSDEISRVSNAEIAQMEVDQQKFMDTLISQISENAAAPQAAQTPLADSHKANAEDIRPPVAKKLRRFAEYAGIAALGGVAVMSALIATAPAL